MKTILIASYFALLFSAGCINADLSTLLTQKAPLKEQIIQAGNRKNTVAVINIDGVISDDNYIDFFGSGPNVVELVKSQLELIEANPNIKELIIKINSPGGSTTASDIIYRELIKFKERTNIKVTALMMDVAASGGYYIALAADTIVAHPTTITGSVGVIMMMPNFTGIMNKIGIEMKVYKSGANKDVGSMFREPTPSDKQIIESIIKENVDIFYSLVEKHRHLTPEAMNEVKTAAIFSAQKAKKLGLIDHIGYFENAISPELESPLIITYRRSEFPNDNIYNTRASADGKMNFKAINLGRLEQSLERPMGCYYLWDAN